MGINCSPRTRLGWGWLVHELRMSVLLEPSYPASRSSYTRRELRILALSLGYDGDLFQRAARKAGKQGSSSSTSEREIVAWLNQRLLDKDLDHLFNRHTCDYNALVIKTALHHLKHKTLTFSELTSVRVVFECETIEDPLGLSTTKESVLQALRMVDRVEAPLRVQHIIQGMSRRLQTPGRLQLYEFFDVIASTQHMWSAMEEMEEEEEERAKRKPSTASSTVDLSIDFDKCFETPYQRLLRKLDSDYRRTLIKPKRRRSKHPSLQPPNPTPSKHSSDHVQRSSRDCAHSITPYIERTSSQILLSRNGYPALNPQQSLAVLTRAESSRPHSTCTTSRHRLVTPTKGDELEPQ